MRKTFYDVVKSSPKGRWSGITRPYSPEDVMKLKGTQLTNDYKLAVYTANKLWDMLQNDPYVNSLGAVTGNQAMQMVRAGLRAIYLSGWQVAADANVAGAMYPDQSLYPANSGPQLAKRINQALERADQIEHSEGGAKRDWFAPIVADAEAGFGGPLNCYEIMKAYLEAGVAGVHYEDQLAAEKKCGHLGGKVLIPTSSHIRNLNAARLAADVCGVPALLICRTDAESATLITSDVDPRDAKFIDYKSGRTPEGFHRLRPKSGVDHAIARGQAMAPFADLIWCETSTPNIEEAKRFAEGVRSLHPDKMLAYNCSPSFNWKANLSDATIAKFQRELGAMGYKFQFITLAGFHQINLGMFKLAKAYKEEGMTAYSRLQEEEFAAVTQGYTAVRHQREVGTGYFDAVATTASGGTSSTTALKDSTEKAQFTPNIEPKIIAENLVGAMKMTPVEKLQRAGFATKASDAKD